MAKESLNKRQHGFELADVENLGGSILETEPIQIMGFMY